ncbi:MAG TPA: hypothetical protein VKT70_01130 [Stellaceae bacterium]|nr:hypothetical protein [Stellaceae bacterium]
MKIIVRAVILFVVIIGRAEAQQILRSSEAVRSCLCKSQVVSTLDKEVKDQGALYEQRRGALEALDQEVRQRRAQVNVNNPSEVEAFKALLAQRDKAADDFAGTITARYSETVNRYNQAVAAFNDGCAGNAYDPEVERQVRANLSCNAGK